MDILYIAIAAAIIAFVLAVALGANDAGNNLGTSVGSGCLSVKQAVILGAIFEFAGAVALGAPLVITLREEIINPEEYHEDYLELAFGFTCAMIGSFILLTGATIFKLPVSSAHSLTGGIVGFALVSQADSIKVMKLVSIIASWIISPILGAIGGFLLYGLIVKTVSASKKPVRNALVSMPIWYGITVGIMSVFLILKGAKGLGYTLDLAYVGVGAIAIAVFTTLVVRFTLVPKYRRQFESEDASPTSEEATLNDGGAQLREIQPESVTESPEPEEETVKAEEVEIEEKNEPKQSETTTKDKDEEIAEEKSEEKGEKIEGKAEEEKTDEEEKKITPKPKTPVNTLSIEIPQTEEERKLKQSERVFIPLLVLTAICLCFAHGAGNNGNCIGPFDSVMVIRDTDTLETGEDGPDPELWILAYGGFGIAVGLILFGKAVMETIGTRIVQITFSKGFAAQLSSTIVVLVAAFLGIPTSTTHVACSAVVGVGLVRDSKSMNTAILKRIGLSWVTTLPSAAIVSMVTFLVLRPLVL
eukprot:TRINITY_DN3912_c0_g1_i1.p1 TRINITY_DN3912_c0_g1~~TRINITY_DN3912_c0_g1_i1.p1  ORF type:complete len:530 (+),score=203.01 TRINITY_DN3912_c0_g1_i1:97-1686(+)